MFLREIPFNKIEESIETAARQLDPDPGEGYKGECQMFRGADKFPVCRGICKKTNHKCHILRLQAKTGTHSDLYDILIICTCKTMEEIEEEFRTGKQIEG